MSDNEKTPYEQRLDELFEQELENIKENERKMTEKAQQENGPFNPTDEELRHDLITHISDSYKSVFGVRPKFINYNEMSTDELNEKAEQVQDYVRKDIALERAQDKLYNERYEQAQNTPGAIISENPDYSPEMSEDEHNRPYNIYIPEQEQASVGNFLGDKFKEAFQQDAPKQSKRRNSP